MANDGYIKLYRKMREWGWYKDANTMRVFLHLLFIACYEDKQYRGVDLSKGEAVVTEQEIGDSLGITRQNVRTAVAHLILTGELTRRKCSKYTVFSIKNYIEYQGDNQTSNREVTNDQPRSNHAYNTKKLRREEVPPIPPTGGAAAVDENLKILVNAYQQDIGTLSRTTADMLRSWTEEFDVELIRAAIAEAAMQNKRTLSYVSGILKRCRECGVTTAAEFEAEKQNHGKKEEPVHETRYLNDPRYHS